MALTQDDVVNILKLIDHAPIGRFSLEFGELKLEVVKGQPAAAAAPLAKPRSAEAVAPDPAPALPRPAASEPAATAGLTPIRAPLLGIFYRQPQPGTPPFVEEGALVDEETTVALIEVMKLFNPVKAGIKGRIRRICVDNGALVEYEQELFLVEPA